MPDATGALVEITDRPAAMIALIVLYRERLKVAKLKSGHITFHFNGQQLEAELLNKLARVVITSDVIESS